MKYKLINTTTNQETLCDKVTIDGFDYYVSDEKIHFGYVWNTILEQIETMFKEKTFHDDLKGVIATNNPNINIPKVVDEVVKLSNEHQKIELELGKTLEGAVCSKYGFMTGYNKSQEDYPFSEEDMVEFQEWCDTSEEAAIFWRRNRVDPDMSGSHNDKIKENIKKLLQLWKEQQPKIVWYE